MASVIPFQRSRLVATPWSKRVFVRSKNLHSTLGTCTMRLNSTLTRQGIQSCWNPQLQGFGRCHTSAFSVIKQQYFSSRPLQENEPITEAHGKTTPTHPLSQDPDDGNHNNNNSNNNNNDQSPSQPPPLTLMLTDERLPVAQHLDPDGTTLPTSDWIHINGTLPIGSLDQVIHSVEQILREEEQNGIIDLDAEWNPFQDPQVPFLFLDTIVQHQQQEQARPPAGVVEAAHVVLSPFGRPNGWHLKLPNRSLVYSLLDRSQRLGIRIGWKLVAVQEYHYSKETHQREDPAFAQNNGLIVDDSMIRIENCPATMNIVNVRHMVTRYELAHDGTTVFQWRGRTNDGKIVPRMFIVRFASPSWARAAVRDLQSTDYMGQVLRLVQFPKQIRYDDERPGTKSNDYR